MSTATIAAPKLELPSLRPSDEHNLVGTEPTRDHLSHSSLATQVNCLRRYQHSYIERLERIARPKPLTLGSAFHWGIEHSDPEAAAAQLRTGAQVAEQADEDQLRIDEVVVRCAVSLYLARWPHGEEATREYPYRVRLRNPWTGRYSNTFDLLGYADGLDRDEDGLVLVEDKLVGQIAEVNVRLLPLNRQVALACYGIWRASGEQVSKVRYRFVRKPSIRPKQSESIEQFLVRLESDYVERAADFYSHEETFWRAPEDLAQVEAELWEWAEQLRAARRRRFYPRNTSQCGEYGGCPFIPICTGDPDARSLYRERPDHDHATKHQEVPA